MEIGKRVPGIDPYTIKWNNETKIMDNNYYFQTVILTFYILEFLIGEEVYTSYFWKIRSPIWSIATLLS